MACQPAARCRKRYARIAKRKQGRLQMAAIQTRRRLLTTMALAGAAGIVGVPRALAGEGPPETTIVRLAKVGGVCPAPQYGIEELLRAEGFTEILYVEAPPGVGSAEAVAAGKIDFCMNYAAPLIVAVDTGAPITSLAGVHVGCFELLGKDSIRTIRDLKGKSVGVQGLGSSPHLYLMVMAAHVGLDPIKEINWV